MQVLSHIPPFLFPLKDPVADTNTNGIQKARWSAWQVHVAPVPPTDAVQDTSALRHSAVWYPEVPAPTLCLNDDSFLPRSFFTSGYKPLFWSCFGGPGGVYLAHLTRIRVSWVGSAIRCIKFSYNTDVSAKHQLFERQQFEGYCSELEFDIDGPGGEGIESIAIAHYYPDPDIDYGWVVEEGNMVRCEVRPGTYRISPVDFC